MGNMSQTFNSLNKALIKYKWTLFKYRVLQAKDDPHISFQYGKLMYALHAQGYYSWTWDSSHATPSSLTTLLHLGFVRINHDSSIRMFSDDIYRKCTCTLTQEGKNYLSYTLSSPIKTHTSVSSHEDNRSTSEHHENPIKHSIILPIIMNFLAVIMVLGSWIIFWNIWEVPSIFKWLLFGLGQIGFFGLSISAQHLYNKSEDRQPDTDFQDSRPSNMSFNSGGHYLDANYVFANNYDEYEDQVQQLKHKLSNNNMMTRKHCIIFLDDYDPVHMLENNKDNYILSNIINSMFPS